MPQIDPNFRDQKDVTYPGPTGEIILVIANATFGETLYIGWTANYVGFLENGHSKQSAQ